MRAEGSRTRLLVFLQCALPVVFLFLFFGLFFHLATSKEGNEDWDLAPSTIIDTRFRSISYSVSPAKHERHAMKSKNASSMHYWGIFKTSIVPNLHYGGILMSSAGACNSAGRISGHTPALWRALHCSSCWMLILYLVPCHNPTKSPTLTKLESNSLV